MVTGALEDGPPTSRLWLGNWPGCKSACSAFIGSDPILLLIQDCCGRKLMVWESFRIAERKCTALGFSRKALVTNVSDMR